MADENDTNSTIEAAEAIAPEPKKQRAPRQKKAVAEVNAPAPAEIVKSPRVPRKKRTEQSAEAVPAVADEKVVSASKTAGGRKAVGRPKAASKVAKPAAAAPARESAFDDIADLIQLEEENKSLRKALSEKLRAENADLRKRLGQA